MIYIKESHIRHNVLALLNVHHLACLWLWNNRIHYSPLEYFCQQLVHSTKRVKQQQVGFTKYSQLLVSST